MTRRGPLYRTERGKAYHRDTCDVVLQAIAEDPRRISTIEVGRIGKLFPCQLCDPPRFPTLTLIPGTE